MCTRQITRARWHAAFCPALVWKVILRRWHNSEFFYSPPLARRSALSCFPFGITVQGFYLADVRVTCACRSSRIRRETCETAKIARFTPKRQISVTNTLRAIDVFAVWPACKLTNRYAGGILLVPAGGRFRNMEGDLTTCCAICWDLVQNGSWIRPRVCAFESIVDRC